MNNKIVGSYYGHYDCNKKSKRKFYQMAIEEYIANTIEKEKIKFSHEITRIIDSFKKENNKNLKRIEEKLKDTNDALQIFKNFFHEVVNINDLKIPALIVNKNSSKKKKSAKIEEEDDDSYDGYL